MIELCCEYLYVLFFWLCVKSTKKCAYNQNVVAKLFSKSFFKKIKIEHISDQYYNTKVLYNLFLSYAKLRD